MRVLNDREEETQPTELGFLSLVAHAFLVALGMGTILLGPLPMILSHLKLTNPWPKLTAVLGAVLALTFFEMSPIAVVILFVFSLYVADAVERQFGFWQLLGSAGLVALIVGGGCLIVSASIDRTAVGLYWTHLIDGLIAQVQATIHVDKNFQWALIRGVLLYEGPFLYLSLAILSVWFSLGLAAHLKWFGEEHPFSASNLRKIKMPKWASYAFLGLFVASVGLTSNAQYFVGGLFRLAGALMFIQGSITLSKFFERKGARQGTKAFYYVVAIVLGFYAIVGMGVVSPWFFDRRRRGSGF